MGKVCVKHTGKLPVWALVALALVFVMCSAALAVPSIQTPTMPGSQTALKDGDVSSISFDADGGANMTIELVVDGVVQAPPIYDDVVVAGPIPWTVASVVPPLGTTSTDCALKFTVDANPAVYSTDVDDPFIIDNTPPDFTDGPAVVPAGWTNADSATVTWTPNDLDAQIPLVGGQQVQIDGGGYSDATSPDVIDISGFADGTYAVDVKLTDGAGNETIETVNIQVDNTAPDVTISAPSGPMTQGGPITYTITYADANGIAGITLANADVTLNKTGTANGTVNVTGAGLAARTVTISGITGDGTLGISIAANTATDDAGNGALGAGPSTTFIVDNTPPSVTISAPSAALTRGGPITYTIDYADANGVADITLANPNNVTLNTTGTANGTVNVTGAGLATRTVTISGITGDGTLGISIAANTSTDVAGNNALGAGPSAVFTADNTPPTVSIGGPSAALTQGGPITYTITYTGADAITLADANVTLNKTGTADGTVAVTGAGLAARTVTISGITGDGTLGITIAANTASDTAGNNALGAGPSLTFIADNTRPSVTISAPSGPLTNSGDITYTVTYADANGVGGIGLADADITLNKTGTANGTVAVTGAGLASRTVTISGITGDGTLGISIAASTAIDNAGNNALGAGPSAAFTADNTRPSVTIGAPALPAGKSAAASGDSVTYTISYADANGVAAVSLVNANITLNKTGTANGIVNVTGAGVATRTVTISGITGDGTLGISIAAGTATDNAGNTALGAGPSGAFTTDDTLPTASIVATATNYVFMKNGTTNLYDVDWHSGDAVSGVETVQFQYSSDDGAHWLSFGAPAVGVGVGAFNGTTTFDVSAMTPSDVYRFRVVVMDRAGNTFTSAASERYGVYDQALLPRPVVKILTPANGLFLMTGMTIKLKARIEAVVYHDPRDTTKTWGQTANDPSIWFQAAGLNALHFDLVEYSSTKYRTPATGATKTLATLHRVKLAGEAGPGYVLTPKWGAAATPINALGNKVAAYEWEQTYTLNRKLINNTNDVFQLEVAYADAKNKNGLPAIDTKPAAPAVAQEPRRAEWPAIEFARFWLLR